METNTPLPISEQKILNMVKDGYVYKEIGPKLGLSYATVKMHMRLCCARLGARNMTHAVVIALRRGYIKLGI